MCARCVLCTFRVWSIEENRRKRGSGWSEGKREKARCVFMQVDGTRTCGHLWLTHTSYGNTRNLLWNHVVVVEPYPNGTYRRYCREDVWDSDDRRITLCDDCNDDCNGSVDALIGTWAHATREGIRERGGRVHVGICVRKIDEGMTKTAPLMHPCCTLVIRTVSRRQKESNTYHSLTHIFSIYVYRPSVAATNQRVVPNTITVFLRHDNTTQQSSRYSSSARRPGIAV
jgi:hypothetical protein